jgi:arylsulfatase A-like enzyme/Tfp pilus assembly protein PilF
MATLIGCRSSATIGTWPSAPVILVSIDTLRADHLSCYGYAAGSTPNLAALARESIVFETAYTHCPLTLPSHASLFTGLLPARTGVRDNLGFRLQGSSRTLAERFKAAGWHTGGAVSAILLRRETGLGRGFDFYEDKVVVEGGEDSLGSMQRDGAATEEALARWVASQPGPRTFAFLHLYEPHSPYAPPERYRHLALPYDGDVAYADELVGRLLDALRRAGLYDKAIIVVVSDHGEGLKDHGEQEHGLFLYRETLQVPLIVRLPGALRGGSRVAGPVGLIDVAPTLLDLADLAIEGMDGRTLRAALASGRAESKPVYSETLYPFYHFGWSDLYAATDERFSYIRAPRPELYDLVADPRQAKNLAATQVSAAGATSAWLEARVAQAVPTEPEDVREDVRQQLRALGYVGGGGAPPPRAGSRPDPKDKIEAYERLMRALTLHRQSKYAEAVAELQALVPAEPGMFDAWELLGLALLRLGRTPEGISALEKAIALDPMRAEPHLSLAQVYALEHKSDLAIKHAEIATQREPGKAFEVLARLLLDLGLVDRAAEAARKSLADDPSRAMSLFVLGGVSQRAGRCEEALRYFREAEEANRLQRGTVLLTLHASMGDCLARLGHSAQAEAEFLAEIKAAPWSPAGRVGLAMLYRSEGRDAQARETLAALVAAQPKADPEIYWTVVKTFSVLGDSAAARDWSLKARGHFPGDARFR